jgi:hypothetical protein
MPEISVAPAIETSWLRLASHEIQKTDKALEVFKEMGMAREVELFNRLGRQGCDCWVAAENGK